MKSIAKITTIATIIFMTGCVSGLNSLQQREYFAFEQNGVLIEEKNTTTAIVLGFLPGGGSFYAREPAIGVVNLIMWPLSILWDPMSGQDGAMVINYDITKHHLKQQKAKEMTAIENQLLLEEINNKEYILSKVKIENKYAYE